MKVLIRKEGSTGSKKVSDLTIKGKKLGVLLGEVEQLRRAYEKLTTELKSAYIVKKDKAYIIEIDGELKRIKNLELFEESKLEYPLKFYKVEDGKLVKDEAKIQEVIDL